MKNLIFGIIIGVLLSSGAVFAFESLESQLDRMDRNSQSQLDRIDQRTRDGMRETQENIRFNKMQQNQRSPC